MNPFATLGQPLACRPGDYIREPRRAPKPPKEKRVPRRTACEAASAMPTPNPWGLSTMQVSVMNGVIEGATPVEMAQDYGLSFKTVQMHISRAMEKMEAKNRPHAAAKWAVFRAGME